MKTKKVYIDSHDETFAKIKVTIRNKPILLEKVKFTPRKEYYVQEDTNDQNI